MMCCFLLLLLLLLLLTSLNYEDKGWKPVSNYTTEPSDVPAGEIQCWEFHSFTFSAVWAPVQAGLAALAGATVSLYACACVCVCE